MVTLFGVTNAQTLFMAYMNKIFRPFLDKFVMVFIDDILIYSRTHEEHAKHLRILYGILREKKLYTRLSQCDFWMKEILFLRHVISAQGIIVVPAKVEVDEAIDVIDWRKHAPFIGEWPPNVDCSVESTGKRSGRLLRLDSLSFSH